MPANSSSTDTRPRSCRAYAILLSALAIILANGFVVFFVKSEHYIYFWDYTNYWNRYGPTGALFVRQPLDALTSLVWSIRHADYNLLPIVPLVPVEIALGPYDSPSFSLSRTSTRSPPFFRRS